MMTDPAFALRLLHLLVGLGWVEEVLPVVFVLLPTLRRFDQQTRAQLLLMLSHFHLLQESRAEQSLAAEILALREHDDPVRLAALLRHLAIFLRVGLGSSLLPLAS